MRTDLTDLLFVPLNKIFRTCYLPIIFLSIKTRLFGGRVAEDLLGSDAVELERALMLFFYIRLCYDDFIICCTDCCDEGLC